MDDYSITEEISMPCESFANNYQPHACTLPQRASGRFGLLLAVLLSSLLYAAVGLVIAGEGPMPVVEVKLTEFTIEMPTTVPPGPVTFSVTNAGTMEHNFEVEGQGIEKKFGTNLKPGETMSLRVDLPAGTYTVYCPIDDHQKRGMQLELKVAQQQSDSPAPPATF
jgi:plastocyanin